MILFSCDLLKCFVSTTPSMIWLSDARLGRDTKLSSLSILAPMLARPLRMDSVNLHSRWGTAFSGDASRENPMPVPSCAHASMIRRREWHSPGPFEPVGLAGQYGVVA